MLTRLLVVLFCFSLGFSTLCHPQTSQAQAVIPESKTPVQETKPPVAPKIKSIEAVKAPAETAATPVQEPKTEPKTAPKSVAEVQVDPAKQDPAKPDAAKVLLSENLLPASTKFWLSIPDANELEKQFDSTQFGQLAKDPAIKPFVDSLRDQAKEIMDEQNVRLGIELDDLHGVHCGEICIAGVLPNLDGKQQVKGSHGLVLLFDVSKTEKEAIQLQEKINAQFKKRGATIENKEINGVAVTKSTINNQKPIRHSLSNYQAIVKTQNGNAWMLICDNDSIFRDVLRRLAAADKIQKAETLSSLPSFNTIMKQSDLKDQPSHIRWYVDPFGYIQLAQALEDEKRGDLQPRDDWSKILKEQGFGAFKGIGGNISIATADHEILHRTFTYAPENQPIKNNKQVFEMFNFSGNTKPLEPASWVPEDASAHVVGNWKFSDALGGIGGLYDAFLDEEGAFKRTLNDFKVDPDMQLDVVKLVGLLDNRMTVVSAVERPITESSERVVIGIPLRGEPDFVFESLKRATGGQVIVLGGIRVIEVDSAAMSQEFEEDPFTLPGELAIVEEAPPKRSFELFSKRYFAVHENNLLVANNKNYLRKLMAQDASKLAEAEDYIQIKEAVAKLTNDDLVCWRQFGRMDRTLEANYEMIRRGEMGNSQTVLGRLINQVFAKQAANKAVSEGKKLDDADVRKQKLDGSKLPEDYAKSIAPYFGPMGWVMETEKEGWRITGCVIKKKGMTEVVQKTDDDPKDSQQR